MAFSSRINAHSLKEKRGAQCIMGGPMAGWASSSITKGSFQLNLKKWRGFRPRKSQMGAGFTGEENESGVLYTSYLNFLIIKKAQLNHNSRIKKVVLPVFKNIV